MNSKGIGIALGVLAVLVIATILAYRQPASETTAALTNPWSRLDKARVDHITIRRPSAPANQQTLEFEKRDGAWRMTAPGVGPTEARALEDLIDRFAEMNVVAVAGRNASSYATFEVDDEHATRVTLKAGSSALLDVFVGTNIDSGTAVRAPGKPEIFRVDQSINGMVTRAPRDWRERNVTHNAREDVRAVEWTNRGHTYRFTRNGDTWTPAAGTVVDRLDTAKVNSLVDSVTNLHASDFADAGATTGITNDSARVTLELATDSGEQRVTVRVGNNSGDQETYAQREGSDVVFVISRSQADAVNPELTAFQAPLPVDGGPDAATDASAPAAAAEPPGGGFPAGLQMPGMGGPGGPGGPGNQIPPGVMEQIRRQLQQQGAGGAAAPH